MIKRFLLPTFLLIISAAIYLFAANSKAQRIEPLNFEVGDIITDTVQTFPRVNITNSDSLTPESLFLEKLEINVKVIGNIAVTTFDMTFFNDSKRLLEGELVFPLAEGHTISRFAMDVEGKLREAVPVEKQKGRIAFESTVRQNIDPGLLEKTEGNMFKARVYPIPANGRKQIVMAYEHELKTVEELRIYYLPLLHQDTLKHFKLSAQVFNQDQKPYQKTKGLAEEFTIGKNEYVLEIERNNFIVQNPIFFQLPITESDGKVMLESRDDQHYFSATINPKLLETPITPPQKITVFWDVSHSRSNANALEKEVEALRLCISLWKPQQVDFVFFSNEIHLKKSISGNDWEGMKELISERQNDGATQLGCLHNYPLGNSMGMLFSDGLTNFGSEKTSWGNAQLWVLNGSSTADHSRLRQLANAHAGLYINLAEQEQIDPRVFKFWSKHELKILEGEVEEVFPKSVLKSESDGFTVFGKLKEGQTKLTLAYVNPFSREEPESITINLKPEKQLTKSGLIPKMWAQKKVQFLTQNANENKEEITNIGKDFGLVTDNTSLIVLDRVEDYVTHQIKPPAALKAEYFRLLAKQDSSEKIDEKAQLNKAYADCKAKQQWYKQDFYVVEKKQRQIGLGNSNLDSNRNEIQISRSRRVQLRANRGQASTDSLHLEVVHDLNGNARSNNENEAAADVVAEAVEESTQGFDEDRDGRGDDEYRSNQEPPPPPELNRVEDNQERGEVVYHYNASQQSNVTFQGTDASFAFGEATVEGSFKMDGSEQSMKPSITLSAWNPDVPYLKPMRKSESENRYKTYINLKKDHGNSPAFYLDVADVFFNQNDTAMGLRVLSNVAELGYENHTLLRILAHRLSQLGLNQLAIASFERVKELRPEEPQSFRDLGLMYANANEPQKAVELLYHIIKTPWNGRFNGIESTVATEMNHVISKADSTLDLSSIDKRFILAMPTDLRVVLNWDTDNCDMDLWVTDPKGEKCLYSHNRTSTGGRLSQDFTQGYGPEEFLIKKALVGNYQVQVNYYGTRSQKLSGPTTVQVRMTTNYGSSNEKTIHVTRRLSTQKQVLDIGSFAHNSSL